LAIPCAQVAYTDKDGCDLRGEVLEKGSLRCYFRIQKNIKNCPKGVATLLGYKISSFNLSRKQKKKFKKALKFDFLFY
jgi:hypothetical protein